MVTKVTARQWVVIVVAITGSYLLAGCSSTVTGTAVPASTQASASQSSSVGNSVPSTTHTGSTSTACDLFPAQELAKIFNQPTLAGSEQPKQVAAQYVLDECHYKNVDDSVHIAFQLYTLSEGITAKNWIAQGTVGASKEPISGVGDFGYFWIPANTKIKQYAIAAGKTIGDHDVVINLSTPALPNVKDQVIALAGKAIAQVS